METCCRFGTSVGLENKRIEFNFNALYKNLLLKIKLKQL